MRYNKHKEDAYDYWQNIFNSHEGYMLAADYNEFAIFRRLILTFIDDGEKVLDVGCASGDTFGYSDELGKDIDYTGVDYCEKFIRANKKRLPLAEWKVMDARSLKFADSSFDTVILYDVLDYLEDWKKAVDEAIRVTKNKIIILMWMDKDMMGKVTYLRQHGWIVVDMDISGGVHYHKFILGVKV